jgi:hypothetical protein
VRVRVRVRVDLGDEARPLRRVEVGPRIQIDQRERHVVAVVRNAGRDVAVGRRRVHEDLLRARGDGELFSLVGPRDAQLKLTRWEKGVLRFWVEADVGAVHRLVAKHHDAVDSA